VLGIVPRSSLRPFLRGFSVQRAGWNWKVFASFLALFSVSFGVACAQAVPTADRPNQISAFASAGRIYTDYGQDDFGFVLGGDMTRHFRFLAAGLEARYTHSSGDAITENSFAGGVRAEKSIRRFRPYADFLIGYGTIHFIPGIPGYTHDNSVVYDIGAGLEYDIAPSFAVKFDAQQQYWHLGQASSELEPYNVSVGVVYRIPFGLRRR
jgi:opacity protein-like surface antigen